MLFRQGKKQQEERFVQVLIIIIIDQWINVFLGVVLLVCWGKTKDFRVLSSSTKLGVIILACDCTEMCVGCEGGKCSDVFGMHKQIQAIS